MRTVFAHLGHLLARLFGHGCGCAILATITTVALTSEALAVCGQQQATQSIQQAPAPQVISLAPAARTATQSISTASVQPAVIQPVCNTCNQAAFAQQSISTNQLSTFYLPQQSYVYAQPAYLAAPAVAYAQPAYSTYAAPYQVCPQCTQRACLGAAAPPLQSQPLEEAPPAPPQSFAPAIVPHIAMAPATPVYPVVPLYQQPAVTPLLVTTPAVASQQVSNVSYQKDHHFLGFLPKFKQTQVETRDGRIIQKQRGAL